MRKGIIAGAVAAFVLVAGGAGAAYMQQEKQREHHAACESIRVRLGENPFQLVMLRKPNPILLHNLPYARQLAHDGDAEHFKGSAHFDLSMAVRDGMYDRIGDFPEPPDPIENYNRAKWQHYAESIGYGICIGI